MIVNPLISEKVVTRNYRVISDSGTLIEPKTEACQYNLAHTILSQVVQYCHCRQLKPMTDPICEAKPWKYPKCGEKRTRGTSDTQRGAIQQMRVDLLLHNVLLLLPGRADMDREQRNRSSHAGFYGSQAALMALSGVYSFGTVSERTHSGALAASGHLSLLNPIKGSKSKEAGKNKQHSMEGWFLVPVLTKIIHRLALFQITQSAKSLVLFDCCTLDQICTNFNISPALPSVIIQVKREKLK